MALFAYILKLIDLMIRIKIDNYIKIIKNYILTYFTHIFGLE